MLKGRFNTRIGNGLICLAAAGLAVSVAEQAAASDIPLVNPSFELPPITPDPNSQDPSNFVIPVVFGWTETGPITSQQGFTGRLDTGVFVNIPVQIGPGVFINPIPNADGNQLGFMQVNPLADGVTQERVSISQEVAQVYEAGKTYTFTLGIAPGVIFPPTGDANNPATIVLSLGFLGPNSGQFIDIQNFIVKAEDVMLPGPAVFPPLPPSLIDFSVVADPNAINSPTVDGPALGNEIVVKVTQIGGTGGGFNLDKARLSVVPEPTSLALLSLAGLTTLRRRR